MGAKKKSKKNSLVGNTNERKRAGKSRPKSAHTVSKDSYDAMQKGWPKKKKAKKASRARKKTSKK